MADHTIDPAQFAGASRFHFDGHLDPEQLAAAVNEIVRTARAAGAPTKFDAEITVSDAEHCYHLWAFVERTDPVTGEQFIAFDVLDTTGEVPDYRPVRADDPGAFAVTVYEQ